jgi:putative Mg2+ transporter-C (MgtC) family protein
MSAATLSIRVYLTESEDRRTTGTNKRSIPLFSFLYRLLAAVMLGAIVGVEPQWRHRMAGTRTNALVAAGASAFVMAGSLLVDDPCARGGVASYVVFRRRLVRPGVIF